MDKLCLRLILRKYEDTALPASIVPYLLYHERMHLWFCSGQHRAEIYMSDDLAYICIDDGKPPLKSHPITNECVLLFMLSQISATLLDEVLAPPTAYSFGSLRTYPGATTSRDKELLSKMFLSRRPL